jgi:putative esterase
MRSVLVRFAPVGFWLAMAGNISAQSPQFEVSIAPALAQQPVTGRLVVIVSTRETPEPRLAVSPQGPAICAIDLERLPPGAPVVVDTNALGYPQPLDKLPPGEYFVQAVVNVYEQVRRADGHTIWVHMNDGSQETFTVAAGNLYSAVQRVTIGSGSIVRLAVTHRIPAPAPSIDTEWVKQVRIQSNRLSRFWGRPVFIHATVLLPKGYAAQPRVRYPTVFTFGHNVPFSFSTDSARTRNIGQINPTTGLETGYDFYRSWTSEDFPRFIAVSFEQQTPYFPDSYSINSANNGPYGDVMVEEVIPELEKRFRMIGKPYARLVEGASTGGWQALALQLHYPDVFGGAWVLQPDPIDFRRYQLVNIYEDENAFSAPLGHFGSIERPFRRTVEGQLVWTVRELSLFEEVLGTRGRSSYQLGGWEAVYGPVGADGYPKPLWNKVTGKIDREVAHYMREHGYDLREYTQRNWATLGPKLLGKLHFFAGDMDDFYLNLAVYSFEEFLKSTSNPRSDARFSYGRPMKGHSWHEFTWAEMVRRMGAHVKANTPVSESDTLWNH